MKKKRQRQIKMSAETIRILDPRQAETVGGGMSCPTDSMTTRGVTAVKPA